MADWADEIVGNILGPFHDDLDEIATALRRAKADGRLSGVSPHSLTSAELTVIERHCDWQAFKHAMGALYNFRAYEIEKGNA